MLRVNPECIEGGIEKFINVGSPVYRTRDACCCSHMLDVNNISIDKLEQYCAWDCPIRVALFCQG
jgi:hypothetical protein